MLTGISLLLTPSLKGTPPKTGGEFGFSCLHEVQSYPKLSLCFRGTSGAEGVSSQTRKDRKMDNSSPLRVPLLYKQRRN